MLGPVIEGERIRLEPPRPEYLPAYVRWDQSNVLWAIVARTSGRLVGNTALEKIN
jgi:hypothetical protein